jgi:hypothetical protein
MCAGDRPEGARRSLVLDTHLGTLPSSTPDTAIANARSGSAVVATPVTCPLTTRVAHRRALVRTPRIRALDRLATLATLAIPGTRSCP